MTDSDQPEQSKANSLIEEHLKRVYGDLQKEASPDRFKDLLSKLREQEAKSEKPQT